MVPRVPSSPVRPFPPPRARSKASYISSHSNEADDERSVSNLSIMAPEPNRRPQYAEEDTRLTSTKEIAGFYAYGWAAEVFVVCGIGSFIPITLEQLARERGVLLTDKTTPCHASFTVPSPPALDYSSVPPLSTYHPAAEAQQCVVYILGVEINTASFALYTFSISVLIQSLLIISMSAAADHGHFRKMFLLTFAFTGAIATILFLSVIPKVYIFGAFLAIVANTCFGASFVLLNSFLPLLVRHHPTVQFEASFDSEPEEVSYIAEATEDQPLLADESIVNSTAALSSEGRPGPDLTTPNPRSPMTPSKATQLSTKISSYGIGIGYIAALIVQTLAIVILLYTGSTVFSLRLVLSLIGAWWFIFTLPAASWLRPRPGPPLRFGDKQSKGRICFAYFTYSWRSLAKTVMKARRLKDMVLFLAAWFLLSDGIATVSGTAVLFAKTTLQMKPAALALINVIATLSGVLGAFTWSRISLFLGLQPSQTILACICLFEVIPFYGLLGYIPAIQRLGVLGLQQPWEMYPLGAVYGFVLGGLSSYCRSMYGDLIPPGFEAAFYALYAITDKGSSVFGPAIVGAITDAYGEIRPAFWFLAILIGLPFPLMLMVDGERGKREATLLAEELSGRNTHQTVIEREEESHNEVFASSGTDSDFDRR